MILGDIISYPAMCMRKGRSLQHGMNFRVALDHSVILMSRRPGARRPGAPYKDQIKDGGRTLLYEGHDVPRSHKIRDPKKYDQPRTTPSGQLTPNGKFENAALSFKAGQPPEPARVYEKIKDGIWTYNGVFHLIDAWQEASGGRSVFKFRFVLTDVEVGSSPPPHQEELSHNRLIPSAVKREVYQRDKGQCVICGKSDNLHFDHDFPFSKGGTSLTAKNIRLLCARHNLQKHDQIE